MRAPVAVLKLVGLLIALLELQVDARPAPALYYDDQLVDHLVVGNEASSTWSQRYYFESTQFTKPGCPIFVVLGGEGAIEPTTGFFYPFIDHLAELFSAAILQPEHRFYGQSWPIEYADIEKAQLSKQEDPRVQLLTTEQALLDAIQLIHEIRESLGCAQDPFATDYCPVIAVGGSYPGFMAAMARLVYPHVFDMAYAASAPLKFYAQMIDQYAYYNHITDVAEDNFPGCASAVRTTLEDMADVFHRSGRQFDYTRLSICNGTLPSYIQSGATFVDEVVMMAGYTFANANMAFYPPSNSTHLASSCATFLGRGESLDKLARFFVDRLAGQNQDCFNMTEELPHGRYGTITGGDWSGDGTGASGESWDFQTCTLTVEHIGFGPSSMFPPRNWTMDWLIHHCERRFRTTPRPYHLVQQWRFDDFAKAGATRIVFTNGLNDGWSVGGVKQNLSDLLPVVNFVSGAHHSDLSYAYTNEATVDVVGGRRQIQTILSTWLAELPGGVWSSL